MRNKNPAYSLHSENYTVLPQRFCRVPYVGFTLVRAGIATQETWLTLSDSVSSKETPKIGRANEQNLLHM
jgi:hypothetical protein